MSEVKINELIDIEKIKPEEFFTATGFEITLARITADVRSVVVDVKTERGRKDLASLAHKIARSKTAIDDLGKDFVSVLKEKSKKVDESRKSIRDYLDQLKEEIRRPLTEIEEAEKKRIEEQKSKLGVIRGILITSWRDPLIIIDQIKSLEKMSENDFDNEFKEEFKNNKVAAIDKLNQCHAKALEDEAKELEIMRLKKEANERDQKERERIIAENAARKAKEETEQKQRDAIAKAEREKAEAEFKLKQAEIDKQKEIQAIKDKQLAEENRIKKEKEEFERQEKIRIENTKHKAEVNNKAKNALIETCAIEEQLAKNILTAIIKNQIPNVTIKY